MNLKREYDAAVLGILKSDGQRIAELEAERDNAWTELREIRAAISANPEESTLDEVVKLRQQLAAAQAEVLEKGRVIGMAFKREIDLRQQLAEFKHGQDAYQQLFNNEKAENIWLHKQITMLLDTIRFFMKAESDYDLIEAGKKFTKVLAETEPITNYGDDSIRRRNADDMGNPPANAAEMLNAWKSKP